MPSAQTGVHFTNELSDDKAAENQIRLNGSGVALGDFDNNGWCDVYFCNLQGPNRLFFNQGQWKFKDAAAAAGAACEGQFSTGATAADVDGDRDLDLLVNGIGTGTRLFLNNGSGAFAESTESGLLRRLGATTSTLADVDGDGDLDLYVANYRTTTIRTTGFAVLNVGGKRMIRPEDRDRLEYTPQGRVLEHGEPDIFYLNDGSGRFTPVNWAAGIFLDEQNQPLRRPPLDWGLSAMFRDLNGDRYPDLYVCNDFHSTDKTWINDGKGHFRPIPPFSLRNTTTFSMTVDVGDLNRDGFDDIFVADMLSLRHERRMMQLAASDPYSPAVGVFNDRPQFDRNTIHLNRGDGTYAEIAHYAGIAASEWTWSAILLDVDLDGFEDLLCTTGHMFDTQDLDAEARIQAKGPWRRDLIPQKLLMFPKMQQPKVAFRNRGNLTFEPSGDSWGFNQPGLSHGMALGDLDNDGDLDIALNNLNSPAGLYRNDSPAPRVAVRLKGVTPNTHGIGARIRVTSPGIPPQTQEMMAGGRYLSGDQPVRAFAAGTLTNRLAIEISWRNGRTTVLTNVSPDGVYEIDQPSDSESNPQSPGPSNPAPAVLSLFAEIKTPFDPAHADELFDDFARQPLLPKKLSQLGPGLAWIDANQDGKLDLAVGSGRGGVMSLFLQQTNQSFARVPTPPWNHVITRDQTSLIAFHDSRGPFLLTGSSNYEDGLATSAMVRIYDLQKQTAADLIPGTPGSCGPLAMADTDNDGDLDLFVGTRVLPGRWPSSTNSFLFRNQKGNFEPDPDNTAALASVGMVSGALFADLNDDGSPDLVLACEWGPIRVFVNQQGRLIDQTSQLGFDQLLGWWNGIATGDFDNDGRLDLVASNWGLNSFYQSAYDFEVLTSPKNPVPSNAAAVLLFAGDLDRNGIFDIIEARHDARLKKIVPFRSLNALAQGLPFVRERFATYESYNQSDVFQIAGDSLKSIVPMRCNWLASTVFLNRGNSFKPVILPPEAQFSPAFGITVADFDGDEAHDVFLTQNFFPVHPISSRLDAGRGLLIRGDGQGGFTSVPGHESGLQIYGEGRGSAAADFDLDARIDLAVAQNGAHLKLYRNQAARPGLRIHLKGPPDNPIAIGASIRLIYKERSGPVSHLHAGAGYWSHDSTVQVLSKTAPPEKLWIRWPGGKTTVIPVPPGATEISASQ